MFTIKQVCYNIMVDIPLLVSSSLVPIAAIYQLQVLKLLR